MNTFLKKLGLKQREAMQQPMTRRVIVSDAPAHYTTPRNALPEHAANESPTDHFAAGEREFIETLQRSSNWKGNLTGFVKPTDHDLCVVADMSYGDVHVMATPEFMPTGAYVTMISNLERQLYKVTATVAGTSQAIAYVRQLAAAKTRSLVATGEDQNEMRFARVYDDIMVAAYRMKASDVHFEIDEQGKGAHVRFRIDGRLREWKNYDAEMIVRAVSAGFGSRTKTGTNSGGTFSIERGMSTITRTRADGYVIEGRFSSLPMTDGADVVCRVIVTDPHQRTRIRSFEELGYSPSHCSDLADALERRSGMIIICGETGSGKSTMLQSAMYALPNKAELKRFTLEDPAEYTHPGCRTITVQRGPDDPEEVVRQKFMAALRQLMRMDLDALLLGEIRDQQTAEIAAELVQTGHRLLTTTHGDGCVDVFSRLTGNVLRMPQEVLALRKFISASGYQTLLPVLCSCKVPAVKVLDTSVLRTIESKFGIDPHALRCANHDGCELCRIPDVAGPFGTKGRTVAAEIFLPDDVTRALILQRDWNGVERYWRSRRRTGFSDPDMTGKTAFEHGLYKAAMGMVDIRDVEGAFESLRTYEIFEIAGTSSR